MEWGNMRERRRRIGEDDDDVMRGGRGDDFSGKGKGTRKMGWKERKDRGGRGVFRV